MKYTLKYVPDLNKLLTEAFDSADELLFQIEKSGKFPDSVNLLKKVALLLSGVKIDLCPDESKWPMPQHPEILEGEYFYSNMNKEEFEHLNIPGKRLGKTAYAKNGMTLTSCGYKEGEYLPVFIPKKQGQ